LVSESWDYGVVVITETVQKLKWTLFCRGKAAYVRGSAAGVGSIDGCWLLAVEYKPFYFITYNTIVIKVAKKRTVNSHY
jgi:hypothetical protein